MPKIKKFVPWGKFLIGGVNAKTLLELVGPHDISAWAHDEMGRDTFTTQDVEEGVETIALTPADFGYEDLGYEHWPTTTELFDLTRLAQWSKENAHRLPKDREIGLLPVDIGAHIVVQYKNQCRFNVLWIATERFVNLPGSPHLFLIDFMRGKKPFLTGGPSDPGHRWGLDCHVLFHLRKIA